MKNIKFNKKILLIPIILGLFVFGGCFKKEVVQKEKKGQQEQKEQQKNNEDVGKMKINEMDKDDLTLYKEENWGFSIKYPNGLYVKEDVHNYQKGDYYVKDFEKMKIVTISNNEQILDSSFSHDRDHVRIGRDGSFYLVLRAYKPRDPKMLTDELMIDWIDGEGHSIEIKAGTVNDLKAFVAPEWRDGGMTDTSRVFVFNCNGILFNTVGYVYGQNEDSEFKFIENIIQTFQCLN